MNILLVVVYYPPEIRSASHLFQELAEELFHRGHDVTVVTSMPRYNLTDDAKASVPDAFAVEKGVRVIRVRTLPHNKVSYLLRGVAQLFMPYVFYRQVVKHSRNGIDAVIVYTPPLPLAEVGRLIKKRYGARFVLNVQDIFPRNAVDLGILRNPIAIRCFEWLEARAYAHADAITAHSDSNQKLLIEEEGVPESKVSVLPNWVDIAPFEGGARRGNVRARLNLGDRFVLMFAGVVGPSQDLGFVVDVADRLKGSKDIVFLVVGDGQDKDHVVKKAEARGLHNMLFHPFVSKEEYPDFAREADVGLVCLSSKNRTPVVPGKILGYMAASLPIVAFLNKESDGHAVIQEAACGFSAVSDDPTSAAEIVLKMHAERASLAQYGARGLEYVRAHFERSLCITQLERLLGERR